MALRTVKTITIGPWVDIRVRRDSNYDEYRVEIVREGKVREAETYYTNDRQDADDTAQLIADRLMGRKARRNPEFRSLADMYGPPPTAAQLKQTMARAKREHAAKMRAAKAAGQRTAGSLPPGTRFKSALFGNNTYQRVAGRARRDREGGSSILVVDSSSKRPWAFPADELVIPIAGGKASPRMKKMATQRHTAKQWAKTSNATRLRPGLRITVKRPRSPFAATVVRVNKRSLTVRDGRGKTWRIPSGYPISARR